MTTYNHDAGELLPLAMLWPLLPDWFAIMKLAPTTVEEYAERMRGSVFPPVFVRGRYDDFLHGD